MACSVITVFGADVPLGSAPTSWITGLARQPGGRTAVTVSAGALGPLADLPLDA